MAPSERRGKKMLEKLSSKRCRRQLAFFPRFPLPHVILLATMLRVQGHPLALPIPQPDIADPARQHPGHGYPEDTVELEEASHQEDSSNACRDYDQDAEPQVLYAEELYARMLSGDGATSFPSAGDRQSWERIIVSCALDMPVKSHVLRFSMDWVSEGDNITLAKVLVVTSAGSRKNGCQPQLKRSRHHGLLPCESKPFKIRHLAAVEVTSMLKEQMGQSQFHVYVKRMRHVVAALLVVFNDIGPQELFEDQELMRCKTPAATVPVSEMDMCSKNKVRKVREAGPEGTQIEYSPSAVETSPGQRLQLARPGLQAKRADRLTNMQISDQLTPFETPAHLHRYLNERRKRSVSTSELESVTRAPNACQRLNFTVLPFYDLGLQGLINPVVLEIGKCTGDCPPIVHPSNRVPTYSHLVSKLFMLHPNESWPVLRPCCRPTQYQSFSVLRFTRGNIVLERWPDARVTECTCI